MNKIIIALLFYAANAFADAQVSQPVIDLSEDESTSEHIALAVQNYYKHPNPQQALNLSLELMQQPVFESKTQARLNTWLWSAQILQQQPRLTKKWCKSLKKSKQHIDIAPIFQFANTSAAKRCLKSLTLSDSERETLAQLPDLSAPLEREVLAPIDLDMLWTTFFATGNPQAVHKLVDWVANYDVSKQGRFNDTYAAAVWSLNANIYQDVEIRKMVNEYVNSLTPQQQQAVKTSLQLSS